MVRKGRAVDTRWRVRGWLRVDTPLHVGGADQGIGDQLPLAVDGQDRLYVPGTSLAGVLRGRARGAADQDTPRTNAVWGFIPPAHAPKSSCGHASRLTVHDALLATGSNLRDDQPVDLLPVTDIIDRPSVGIDRRTAAAAPHFLFTRPVVPVGTLLRFGLDLETTNDRAEADRALLAAMLEALARGHLRFGAATSRGLGKLTLHSESLSLVEDTFTCADGLLAVLADDPARHRTLDQLRHGAAPTVPDAPERLEVTVCWQPWAPTMVRGGRTGALAQTVPLTTHVDRDQVALVLPGSSIKGALRSHAAFIERTARRTDAAAPTAADTPGRAFLDQLDELPAVRGLFGRARRAADHPGTAPAGVGHAGTLRVEECAAELSIPDDLWQAVLSDSTTEPPDAGDDINAAPDTADHLAQRGLRRADHVAIDRFTGGAAEARLFSVLEPHHVTWQPIRLSLRLDRCRDSMLALLLLTLRDLADGWLPLGAMTHRGFGDIHVSDVRLTGGGWQDTRLDDALASARACELTAAWQRYLTEAP